jgi:NADH-quinone oxidoreductase subunit D
LLRRRIAQPTALDDFDFAIPVGTSGDTYDLLCHETLKFGKHKYNSSSFGKMPGNEFHADVP